MISLIAESPIKARIIAVMVGGQFNRKITVTSRHHRMITQHGSPQTIANNETIGAIRSWMIAGHIGKIVTLMIVER
jgi:hypothetical protein